MTQQKQPELTIDDIAHYRSEVDFLCREVLTEGSKLSTPQAHSLIRNAQRPYARKVENGLRNIGTLSELETYLTEQGFNPAASDEFRAVQRNAEVISNAGAKPAFQVWTVTDAEAANGRRLYTFVTLSDDVVKIREVYKALLTHISDVRTAGFYHKKELPAEKN